MRTLACMAFYLLFAVAPGAAVAADSAFPTKPIRLIVPFSAGGTSDILARILGQSLGDVLKQPVVVESRPGAGGNIGSEAVARSPADGYTLILASVGTHAINSSLFAKMPYHPLKDFSPVTLIATVPTVLVINHQVPARSVRELIGLAKKNPGKLTFASAGIGTTQQLAGVMFKEQAGIDVLHVPYKGGAPAVTDLVGGQVTMMFPNIPVAFNHIRSGKLRALAVLSAKRSPALPDVPTMTEATGYPKFEVSTWFGILGAAGTPAHIVSKLNQAIHAALQPAEVRAKLAQQGAEPLTSTAEEFAAFIREEMTRWAAVVKQAGIKPE